MNSKTEIKVVIVDDHALIREAVRTLLSERKHISLVGEGSAGEDVLALVEEHEPDVLLLDISMPQKAHDPESGSFAVLPALRALQNDYKETKVIILSQHLQPALIQSIMRSRINGYLLKSDDLTLKLAEAVEKVSRGGAYFSHAVSQAVAEMSANEIVLTDRQKDILLAIAQNPETPYSKLAEELFISERTLKWHLGKAYRKLGVNNIRAAILACIERDLIPFVEDIQGGFDFGVYGATSDLA
jgi:DNA-binding NarL/FixJ family response regulator